MVYAPKYTTALAVQIKTGLTTEVDLTANDYQLIKEAEAEVDMLTGRMWSNGMSRTEYLNSRTKDILDSKSTYIMLSEYPIQSITEFKVLNSDGTTSRTYATWTIGTNFETADYWLETMIEPLLNSTIAFGKVTMKTAVFPTGIKNVKVTYTYGWSAVPTEIMNLASCLAGIRAWVAFLGGNYNRLDSYGIPQQNVSKGDFYSRGRQNIENLRTEADRLLDRIGRRSRALFVGSGGGY